MKFKPHKGILKRVKITRNGKVKRGKVGLGHLCSHKSAARKRKLRRRPFVPPTPTQSLCPRDTDTRVGRCDGEHFVETLERAPVALPVRLFHGRDLPYIGVAAIFPPDTHPLC